MLSVGANQELPQSPQKLPLCPPCALPLCARGPFCVTAKGTEPIGLRFRILRWDSQRQRVRLLGPHRRWDVYLASQLPAPPWPATHRLLERVSLSRHSAELNSEGKATPDSLQPLFHFEIIRDSWEVTRIALRGRCTLLHPRRRGPCTHPRTHSTETQPGNPPHSQPLSHVQVHAFTLQCRHTRWRATGLSSCRP